MGSPRAPGSLYGRPRWEEPHAPLGTEERLVRRVSDRPVSPLKRRARRGELCLQTLPGGGGVRPPRARGAVFCSLHVPVGRGLSHGALSAAVRGGSAQMAFGQWLWTLHPHVPVASLSALQLRNIAVKHRLKLKPLCENEQQQQKTPKQTKHQQNTRPRLLLHSASHVRALFHLKRTLFTARLTVSLTLRVSSISRMCLELAVGAGRPWSAGGAWAAGEAEK